MRISLIALGCALAALSSGCFVDVNDKEPEPSPFTAGTLTVLWTVDNTTDPAACSFYAPDPGVGMNFELIVYDRDGGLVLEDEADCAFFGLSLDLYPGIYDADATMVDPLTDEALSTTLPLSAIDVFERTETRLDIDFPPSSFLPAVTR